MADSGNPKHTIEIIQRCQSTFQKRFGQNFLIDTHILDKVISVVGATEQDCMLEIEPGIGTMTQYLAEHARCVVAVEIDSDLLSVLDGTLKGYMNIAVVDDDTLKVDVGGLVNEYNEGHPIKVVANLSYYITTPIVIGLFESNMLIDSVTVMAQKEMADRMQVGPGSKDCEALPLAAQYYAEPYIMANVPPNCFIPRPNVGFAVIRLIRYEELPIWVDDPKFMFRLVRASFSQRRKTLQSGPSDSLEIPCDRKTIAKAIGSLGAQPAIRGEILNLDQFARSSNYFTRNVQNGTGHVSTGGKRGTLEYGFETVEEIISLDI